jgi:quinolinate synthase
MSLLGKKIRKLAKQKNAVILAHYYQRPEIQDLADFIGDSMALSYQAASTDANIIVFAGVKFMAETAKIISPAKQVLLPDLSAGCSLAESCTAEKYGNFIKKYPEHIKIAYINCDAEVKALSDVVCTSSNALKIIKSIPSSQPILFAPDKNLGRYLVEKSGREMTLWDGSCFIHEDFSEKKILSLKKQHPDAKIIAHPECVEIVIMISDFIGSTSELLNYIKTDRTKKYIVVTEAGIIHQMIKAAPEKIIIPAPPSFYTSCHCNECPHMKVNTLDNLYNCLLNETPEIKLESDIISNASKAINKMFELTNAE